MIYDVVRLPFTHAACTPSAEKTVASAAQAANLPSAFAIMAPEASQLMESAVARVARRARATQRANVALAVDTSICSANSSLLQLDELLSCVYSLLRCNNTDADASCSAQGHQQLRVASGRSYRLTLFFT